jgi:cytochrome b561
MGLKSTTDRYGSVAIAFHWVSALVIIGLLISGTVAAGAPAVTKQSILPIHAVMGSLVLLLTLARLAWWAWADKHPSAATGPRLQQLAAKAVHGLLYVAVLVLGISGIATIALSGALPALLGQGPLPDFSTVPPRIAHGITSKLLLALVAVHIGAALYHQFIRRDRLLARMGLGRA